MCTCEYAYNEWERDRERIYVYAHKEIERDCAFMCVHVHVCLCIIHGFKLSKQLYNFYNKLVIPMQVCFADQIFYPLKVTSNVD